MEVKGSVAIVAGGASGMAKATAEQLAAEGATVAILDLPSSKGAEVAKELGGTFHALDALDYAAAEATINEVVAQHGALHIAVNTIGGGGGMPMRTVGKDGAYPLDNFQRYIDLNLVATFNLNRIQALHMSKNAPNEEGERGVIIDTASIAAFEGQIGQVAYSAAKAGIVGMVFTMARDLGNIGVRVNAIAPSLFATGIVAGLDEERAAVLCKDAAFPKRMGKPHEFANVAMTIVKTPMLNGGTIRVDAGTRFAPK
jgi:NAD(P)-dependent dehydrogenase (short-subunit alcohol dehydrogenase family)